MCKVVKFLLVLWIGWNPCVLSANHEPKNALIVCENSLEMFHWDLDFIRLAEQSIEISGSFCGGSIFREMLTIIGNRLRECPKLQVHILSAAVLLEERDRELVENLKRLYPANFHLQLTSEVVVFLPEFSSINNHVKCVIIDEHYFSMGGTNLDSSLCTDGKFTPPRNEKKMAIGYTLPAGTRDGDVVGRGPIARQLRENFFKLYALWEDFFLGNCMNLIRDPEHFVEQSRYQKINSSETPFLERFETHPDLVFPNSAELFFSGPHQSVNVITKKYEALLKEAKEEVVIANLYFNPCGHIMKEAKKAVNRGVAFTLITNGKSDRSPIYNELFCWASRINYVPLFYGKDYHFWEVLAAVNAPVMGTHIYEYYIDDILYHKKQMVVDRRYTVLGSYNLGSRSHLSDYECILVIDSPEIARHILNVIETDKQLSLEITPKEAREWYFNPLTAYIAGTQRQFHGFM